MKENIIGRKKEKELLSDIFHSKKSEFIAVCGRRRVGKTYLIKEFFADDLVFQTSGIARANMPQQIKSFYTDMKDQGLTTMASPPKDWIEVFSMLKKLITASLNERKVILLDELPWMDTPRSGFVGALEHFWNSWVSGRNDIILVVCGSATSWMMDNLINSHGGLHNRITHHIFLEPFTLGESEQYLEWKGIHLSRYEIAECYMILGGIPYYLDLLSPRLSLTQNIDELLFSKTGGLHNEFSNLYAALFKHSDNYIKVVKTLCIKRHGLTRQEIIEHTDIPSGKGLTTILKNLEYCGFIYSATQYKGDHHNKTLYQLVDFFTLFHYRFIEGKKTQWSAVHGTPAYFAWAGLTFETLVFNHIREVKRKLGISGVITKAFPWRSNDPQGGAQIDLVIDRTDQTINLCEIKYSLAPFIISKEYENNLRNKYAQFVNYTQSKKSIQITFITSYGVVRGKHSGIVSNEVVLDDLFE